MKLYTDTDKTIAVAGAATGLALAGARAMRGASVAAS